jgi:hypothetical protein
MGFHNGLPLAVVALAGMVACPVRAEVLNRWVQYGPDDTMLIRSISSVGTTACPPLTLDGNSVQMTPRFTPTADYPVLVCEASLPIGNYAAKVATIDGAELKLPAATPQRILVIGDTGCRVDGGKPQDCNNYDGPLDFPLAALSNYAATFKPDLIIHTGDFFYREKPCPAEFAKQCGSPDGAAAGDIWAAWDADWFTPARKIMQTAPMAITRGNHESCDRGAVGWFRLLAPQPYSEAAVNCGPRSGFSSYRSVTPANPEPANRDPNDTTPSYVVQAGPIALIMFDISYASDTILQAGLDADYAADLNRSLGKLQGKPAFFVVHKPAYGLFGGLSSEKETKTSGTPYVGGGNINAQSMFGTAVAPQISLFVSGHIHNFEVVDLQSPKFAPQLVIGNSGTRLDKLQVDLPRLPEYPAYRILGVATSSASADPGEIAPSQYLTDVSDFGFAVLDAMETGGITTGYVADVYDLHAGKAGHCMIVLRPRAMTCSR